MVEKRGMGTGASSRGIWLDNVKYVPKKKFESLKLREDQVKKKATKEKRNSTTEKLLQEFSNIIGPYQIGHLSNYQITNFRNYQNSYCSYT